MKYAIKVITAVVLLIVWSFCVVGCSTSDASLPKGHASQVRVQNGESYWNLGAGEFEYINETTIQFKRDKDQEIIYLSTSTLIAIWVEDIQE